MGKTHIFVLKKNEHKLCIFQTTNYGRTQLYWVIKGLLEIIYRICFKLPLKLTYCSAGFMMRLNTWTF